MFLPSFPRRGDGDAGGTVRRPSSDPRNAGGVVRAPRKDPRDARYGLARRVPCCVCTALIVSLG
jgi:hypothetical protein